MVYLGDGQGGFGSADAFYDGSGPGWVVAADYNGDGDSDLATANSFGTASVLLGNGAGGFGPSVTFLAVAAPLDRSTTRRISNATAGPTSLWQTSRCSVSVIFNACSATTFFIPVLSVGDTMVTEGDSGTLSATFNVSLSAASNKTVAVSFYSVQQEQRMTVDFQNTLGRVIFPPGDNKSNDHSSHHRRQHR